jgi:hypothetical protein
LQKAIFVKPLSDFGYQKALIDAKVSLELDQAMREKKL